MNPEQTWLALCVAVPIVGSLILPLLGKTTEAGRNWLALLLVAFSFGSALALLPLVVADGTATFALGGVNLLHADKLAVFMALVSTSVGSIIVFYSWGYIAEFEHRNEYYFMVVLFLGSMMGLVFARNLIFLYVFWEITAIACWRLIGFFREKAYVLRADKAFLITVFGAVLMLIGFIDVGVQNGSFDLGIIKAKGLPVSDLAVALMLCGIFAKSATLPLHTWLPDAGVAPSPVTALLHAAVLVKIGVYVFARLMVATFVVSPVWHDIVPWIAGASALVSACAALIDTDLKRIIAYSTVSQIGFIFLGLAVDSEMAVGGGLLYILMHGVAKGGLFLCAGIVEHGTHTKDITKLGGLIKTMPVTAISFALCAFSVMGIPPFGGFFSKYLVITGAVTSGQLALSLTFVFGAFLTILYLFRVFTKVFLGAPGEVVKAHPAHEGSREMVASVAALAVLALVSGLLVQFPSQFAESTAKEIHRKAVPVVRVVR
ncbi:MAG: NADH-quinone oxidoreductase subunit L [Deltaproteobacteria bacterium]|nr:NADH-quinone oxidoreductase subunit L [Deltaproteobacteria bacterium]